MVKPSVKISEVFRAESPFSSVVPVAPSRFELTIASNAKPPREMSEGAMCLGRL